MTSVQNIQSLIAEIDVCLNQAVYPLPWLSTKHNGQQRQLLQRARDYLAILATQFDSTGARESGLTAHQQETAQVIAQQVLKQMHNLQGDSLDSLQTQLDSLTQQKDSLALEVEQLEKQRQQIITEFLPVMTSRWAESLTQKIAQLKSDLAANSHSDDTNSHQTEANWQHLQQLQHNCEQIITSLDTNFQSVFGTLEKDLLTYQKSLAQGLEEIHNLGQQGEVLFQALVQRWTEQLALAAAQNRGEKLPSEDILLPETPTPLPSASTHPGIITTTEPAATQQGNNAQNFNSTNQTDSAVEEQIETLWQITFGEDGWQLCSPSEIPQLENKIPPSTTPTSAANIPQLGEQSKVITSNYHHQLTVNTTTPEPVMTRAPQEHHQGSNLLRDELAVEGVPQMDGGNFAVESQTSGEMVGDVEMITALTDLLGKAYFMAQSGAKEENVNLPDNYTPASPTENLLETNESSLDLEPDSLLSEHQKQALEEDLQNFEQQQ